MERKKYISLTVLKWRCHRILLSPSITLVELLSIPVFLNRYANAAEAREAFTHIFQKGWKCKIEICLSFVAFWGQFHQRFYKQLLHLQINPKSAKWYWHLDYLFGLLGSARVKAVCKHVCKIDPWYPIILPQFLSSLILHSIKLELTTTSE